MRCDLEPIEERDGKTRYRCVRCGEPTGWTARAVYVRTCPAALPATAAPGIVTRAANYAAAAIGHAVAGSTASEATIALRLAICQGCERYDAGRSICLACGCTCDATQNGYFNKLAMAEQACPVGKWASVSPRRD